MEQNGSKSELFGDIVSAALVLLERLIEKADAKRKRSGQDVSGKAER